MAAPSISPFWILAAYCGLTLLASLAGGWIPLCIRLTHTRLQVATSFVAGMMLGVAVLHLLPHAWDELQSIDRAVWWLLSGFLVMFFLQRFFHFHHHDVPDEAPEAITFPDQPTPTPTLTSDLAPTLTPNPNPNPNLAPTSLPPHPHPHPHPHRDHPLSDHTLASQSARHLSWGGAALGLTLHSLIDGVALAASVQAEASHPGGNWLLGFGTFMVVIAHKPFDAMAIGTLMAAGGWSRPARHWVNVVFALAIPIGMVGFDMGASQFAGDGHLVIGAALAFTAGTFLCIAASDLLPELQFHSHDRGKLSLALIFGLVLAALLGKLEGSGHGHGPSDGHEQEQGHSTEETSSPAHPH